MKALSLFAGLCLVASGAFAQDGVEFNVENENKADVVLGRVAINNWERSELLSISQCGVKEIKIRVVGDALRVKDLVVGFRNGGTQALDVRNRFARNTESRWIDLKAGDRCVEWAYIRGESADGFLPSVVEFHGRVRNDDVVTPNPGNGQRLFDVTLRGQPTRAAVNVNRCGLQAMRAQFGNEGGLITKFTVHFKNGGQQDLAFNGVYRANQSTGWDQLRGQNDRCITRVVVDGQSPQGRGASTLRVFAR